MKRLLCLGLLVLAGCGHSQRWEYKMQWVSLQNMDQGRGEKELDSAGTAGWELAAVHGDSTDVNTLLAIYKRKM